jgi:oligogalacturonide transporter
VKSSRTISWKNIIFYGMGDLYGGGSFMIIGLFFLYFLTDVVGLPPAMAGLVFTLGEVWDAVSDPMMGIISDRTHSRFGRRRVYLLAGIVPVFLSFAALWIPVTFSGDMATFLFYGGVYLLFNTVFTMVMVPYSALNADMTPDYRLRTRLSGTRIIFSQVSTLIAATVPKVIIDGASSDSAGFLLMGLIFGAVYALPFLMVYFGTFEELTEREEIPVTLRTLKTIFLNRSFRVHIGMYIAAYTAIDILMALFLYFMKYYMEREGLYTLAIGSLIVTQISMLPLFTWLANRRGKAFAYRAGLALSICGFLVLLLFLRPDSPLLLVILPSVLIGAGLSAASMIPWAMLPTVVDVDELMSGSRRSGLYAGGMTLIRKIAQGVIALPAVGFMLDILGFIPNRPQTELVREGIRLFLIIGPSLLFAAGILVSFGFHVTPKTHAIIRREIARRRGDDAIPLPDTEEIRLLGLITGSDYRP